jgi:hypothetical protein
MTWAKSSKIIGNAKAKPHNMKLLIISLLAIISCKEARERSDKMISVEKSGPGSQMRSDSASDFSILIGDKMLTLKDWTNENDPEKLLGNPKSEKLVILGEGADTHMGSSVKTLIYDGLEIHMFSPKQNGKTFWIKDLKLTNRRYRTARGIKIGDSVKKLSLAYPKLEQINPTVKAYIGPDDNYIHFAIQDSLVSEIHVFHEIP